MANGKRVEGHCSSFAAINIRDAINVTYYIEPSDAVQVFQNNITKPIDNIVQVQSEIQELGLGPQQASQHMNRRITETDKYLVTLRAFSRVINEAISTQNRCMSQLQAFRVTLLQHDMPSQPHAVLNEVANAPITEFLRTQITTAIIKDWEVSRPDKQEEVSLPATHESTASVDLTLDEAPSECHADKQGKDPVDMSVPSTPNRASSLKSPRSRSPHVVDQRVTIDLKEHRIPPSNRELASIPDYPMPAAAGAEGDDARDVLLYGEFSELAPHVASPSPSPHPPSSPPPTTAQAAAVESKYNTSSDLVAPEDKPTSSVSLSPSKLRKVETRTSEPPAPEVSDLSDSDVVKPGSAQSKQRKKGAGRRK